ncbi:MAG: hypothetical protein QXJ17_02240 [Nitrososphaeria archaeon]
MIVMPGGNIGKCPKCDQWLNINDILDVNFRGGFEKHYAYVCKKCGYIIGFSSNTGAR